MTKCLRRIPPNPKTAKEEVVVYSTVLWREIIVVGRKVRCQHISGSAKLPYQYPSGGLDGRLVLLLVSRHNRLQLDVAALSTRLRNIRSEAQTSCPLTWLGGDSATREAGAITKEVGSEQSYKNDDFLAPISNVCSPQKWPSHREHQWQLSSIGFLYV